MKRIILIAAAFYLAGGAEAAREIGRIPAVNIFGKLYVAATWPAWINGSPVNLPIPEWAFTFEDSQ